MLDSLAKKLISTFAESWGEAAPGLLDGASTLGLLALREVKGDEVKSALAVAVTWSSAFAVTCSGGLPGILVCLLKSEDCEELERRARQKAQGAADGKAKAGSRQLIGSVLTAAAGRLSGDGVSFGDVQFVDLSADESKLAAIIGDAAWFGTFALTLGTDTTTQALLLYAPGGSLGAVTPKTSTATAAPQPTANVSVTPNNSPQVSTSPSASRRAPARRDEPRNIDRLLDVELEIIVRFGVTHIPLRELVRIGNGSMIELDRSVDEPVELLVNGRHLARGSVVVVDGYYGVRITEIGEAADRPISLVKGD
jgi:flagellar motor switch protein FliN